MLTPQPIATSSILVSPTLQPTGSMMLKRMITTNVKAACPATKEIMEGATPDTSTASGRSAQSRAGWSATPMVMTEPTMKPSAVPPTARSAVAPVPSALERNTERVPSTTQKPCWTFVISITATASARPTPPRNALRNHTERKERWDRSRSANRLGVDSSPIPRRRSTTAGAPAASSAASATISVAIPSARAWNPGSSAAAMLPSSCVAGSASGRTSAGSDAASARVETSAASSAAISSSRARVASCTALILVGSSTGWPSPSQIKDAAWWRVSATFSVIAWAVARPFDQCSSPTMAVLPATHSTRPTSLDSATATAAAPVGGYGVPENC